MTHSNDTSNKLLTVCAIILEYPYVQFQGNSAISKMLAKSLQKRLVDFYEHPNFKKSTIKNPKGKLLILDRSFDLLAPIQHDYYYQTNVSEFKDGFKNDDGEFKFDSKTIYLNFPNALDFCKIGHIAE